MLVWYNSEMFIFNFFFFGPIFAKKSSKTNLSGSKEDPTGNKEKRETAFFYSKKATFKLTGKKLKLVILDIAL